MKRLLVAASIVALVGCSSPVTSPDELARCGPEPGRAVAEGVAKAAIGALHLKDPGSAQITDIRVDGPTKWPDPDGVHLGWQISFWLNAKNSFGGYTGPQKYLALLRADGQFKVRPADAWHP